MAKAAHKKKKEFSKIMAVIAIAMWLLVNLFGLVMMAVTLDLAPMAYVVGSVDAVVAVVLGCYYNKAKLENQIKLKRAYREDAPEPNFNEYGGYENGY